VGGQLVCKADLTAICEPIVKKMWEPQTLTTLWVSETHYRDRLFFLPELPVTLYHTILCDLYFETFYQSTAKGQTGSMFPCSGIIHMKSGKMAVAHILKQSYRHLLREGTQLSCLITFSMDDESYGNTEWDLKNETHLTLWILH
jgi:hypothetical protein